MYNMLCVSLCCVNECVCWNCLIELVSVCLLMMVCMHHVLCVMWCCGAWVVRVLLGMWVGVVDVGGVCVCSCC